jgi:hypothetical protein
MQRSRMGVGSNIKPSPLLTLTVSRFGDMQDACRTLMRGLFDGPERGNPHPKPG